MVLKTFMGTFLETDTATAAELLPISLYVVNLTMEQVYEVADETVTSEHRMPND